MKAQFFILGAVLICAIFFIGLPLYGPQVQSYRKDLSLVSNNLESEFPKAFNLALNASGGIANFEDFSRFAGGALTGQNMKFRALWLVTEPDGTDIQATVGNFMGQEQAVIVTVDGVQQAITVPDNSTETRTFAASDAFDIQIEFPGHAKTTTWIRNKANLYAFLEFSHGADVVIKEIEG